ncbi:MAG: aminopeptidase P family N-terminal domain-containing protein, partial [Sandaracinaceae bacterium]|nr:aminopeptidase P family N-terminal domain-containing protein [Sandaracinaceae bacterium]
ERLRWLTGFNGSAGMAVVLKDKAAIFVDGRYTLQVRTQVDLDTFETKHLMDEPPARWIEENLPKGAKLAYDPWLHTIDAVARLRKAAEKAGGTLVPVDTNPLDAVWEDQPEPPVAKVHPHAIEYAGEPAADKIRRLASDLMSGDADTAVLTMPDSIAWAFNIRGNDVPHTPLPLSFALLHEDGHADLFIDERKLDDAARAHLAEAAGRAVAVERADRARAAADREQRPGHEKTSVHARGCAARRRHLHGHFFEPRPWARASVFSNDRERAILAPMPDRDAIRKYVQAKAHKRKKASPLESMERAIESAMASALDPASLYRPRAKDDAELESALEALDRVERDAELEPRHVGALEAIVNPTDRPVYDVVDGTFTPAGLYAHLSAHVATLERCIAGVGRVEPDNPQIPYAGTAFLAAPTILLTNRHVARLFAEGVGEIRFTPFVTTQLDLKRERDRQDRLTLRIVSVPLVHPYWDLAALEVEGVPDTIAPLALAPEARGSEDVVVIGYPYLDARNPDRALQDRIFDGVYGVKRLQPGELTGTRVIRSFDHDVEALTHDASTLGGNSGSAVVDAASGIVLGIHFAGLYLDANFAVPAWELYRDPRVRALSLHWSSPPSPPAARPEVDRAWQGAVRTELDVPSHAAAAGTQVETLGDWYERTDDETLAREL